ncbi:MAG: PorV/PorQ family protein [Spirochaetes bacterium]|nr:PorV/PorQ family protein [Spirochaetota bacterium]
MRQKRSSRKDIFKGLIFALVIFMLTSERSYSKHSDYVGTTTSQLMEIEVDPRVNSLGGAYCGRVKDLIGYELNIAGISHLKQKHFVFVYYDWLFDTSIQYFAFGMPFQDIGTFAASLKFLSVPSFGNHNDWGEIAGTINVSDYIFSLGFARRDEKYKISYGVNFKYNHQSYSLDDSDLTSVSSLGLDVGVQYQWEKIRIGKIPLTKIKNFHLRNLQLGASLQNIGLTSAPDSLPRKLKIGVAYPVWWHTYFLFDINKNIYNFGSIIDSDWRVNFGVEYVYKSMIFVRGGIRLGYDTSAFTIGVGFQKRFGSFLTVFDYGLAAHDELGYLNNLSLSTKFERLSLRKPLPLEKRRLAEYYYYHGISFFVQGEIEKAIEQWNKVLEIDPDNPDVLERIKEAQEILQKGKKYYQDQQE